MGYIQICNIYIQGFAKFYFEIFTLSVDTCQKFKNLKTVFD